MNFYELYQLINEYGENLINSLTEKFKKEEPSLTPNIIKNYIDRFEKIKNNLPEKDITKYSWKELENTVDGYQTKDRIKTGKLDPTVTDANLLYNKDNMRIYLGKDKKSCIKYGNGYTFCISARGEKNMYSLYRLDHKGTPYFIFNDNLPKEDKDHILVLFVYNRDKGDRYSITDALNKGEKYYEKLQDIINDYPWINPISNFVNDVDKGSVEAEPLETIERILKRDSPRINPEVFKILPEWQGFTGAEELLKKCSYKELNDFLNGNLKVVKVKTWYKNGNGDSFFEFYKNADDILKKIKAKAPNFLSGISKDFKYKESDSDLREKITKALNFKFKTMADYLNYEDDKLYDDGEAANVKFVEKDNENNYFLAKIIDSSLVMLMGNDMNDMYNENIDQLKRLLNYKIQNNNKIFNWLRAQKEETLEKILLYNNYTNKKEDLLPLELKNSRNFTDLLIRFMEMDNT